MKNQKKCLLGLVIAIITLISGISYAYFTATFQNLGVRETSITLAELGSLKLTASEANYTSGNQYPGDMAIQKFEVEPVSKGSGIYELDLTGVIDESIFGIDVEIQLYKSIDTTAVTITEGELTQVDGIFLREDTIVTNGLTPIYRGTLKNGENILLQEDFEVIEEGGTLKIRENSTSSSYSKYTFYLVYNYKNNGNQNIQMGQTFNGTISGKLIKQINGAGTIAKLVKGSDPTSTAVIDKGTAPSGCKNTLAYDDFGNLRYVGSNPCNYVTFNGETAGWRIIGVFDNQIKLIKNGYIGLYTWDTSERNVNFGYGINQWGESGDYKGADLMKLLNPGYETNLAEDSDGNEIAGTYVNNSLYWNKGTGNCYNSKNNVYATCDFSRSGLSENAKSMIEKHTWNLGSQGENRGWPTENGLGLAKKYYEYERSNNTGKICASESTCDDSVNRTTTWEGYIGLIYPSDYGYAVGEIVRDNCLSNTPLHNYYNNYCSSANWLNYGRYWTLMPSTNGASAARVFIVSDGKVNDALAYNNVYGVAPTLFLKSTVEISGSGTATDPYVVSLN